MLAGAVAATLLLSLALIAARSEPIPFALLLLAVVYAMPEGDRAAAAPLYAGALMLTAELSYWSLDERVHGRIEAGAGTPRLLAVLAVAAAGIAASALSMAAAEADVTRSPATTAAGAAAILGCVALLAALARVRG